MKFGKILAIFVIILIASAVLYGYFGAEDVVTGSPRIQVIPPSYDFGDITGIVNHTFFVKNIGDGMLEILHVSTSCACTWAEISSKNIEPSNYATLIVTYDPNFHSPPDSGNIFRVVYIKSNDPEQPEVEIEIRANVRR
jgi:hypothetical protein